MDETEIDLREIVGMLRRQVRLIALVLLVSLAAAIAVLFWLTPVYTASTLILVDPSVKNLLATESQTRSGSADSSRVDSEVEILRSQSTFMNVIREKSLVNDDEFGVKLGLRDKVLTWLRMSDGALPSGNEALQRVLSKLSKSVSVSRRGLTYIVEVQVRSEDPDKAAEIANSISQSYIRSQLEVKVSSTLAARDILQGRIHLAATSVEDTEAAVDVFIFNNMDRISSETGSEDIRNLRSQLLSLERRRDDDVQLVDLIDLNILQADWTSLAQGLQSAAIRELETQRLALVARAAVAPNGSVAQVDLQAELALIETNMARAADGELSLLRASISAFQGRATDLQQQLRGAALSSDLPTDLLTGIFELQQNAQVARAQYQTLLSRLREVETQADLQLADSRIVSPALSPGRVSFPNSRLILGLAGLAGLALGIGLAFLNEHYVGGFVTEAQIGSVLRKPVLAVIPRARSGRGVEDGLPPDMMINAPLSIYSESIRRVRASIDQMVRGMKQAANPAGEPEIAKEKTGIVIMVCSAVPGEGKTTVALSLARAYALSGQKTLLVDSDLRKPAVHRQLGMEPSTGLLDYLSNTKKQTSLAGILAKDTETDLNIIRGSRRSDTPTDQLLIGQRFSTFVDSAAKHYEIVVLDTPPLGPVVDGIYLAPYADVMVMVVRWAGTSQSDVRSSLLRLEQAQRPDAKIGIVLNQQENGSGDEGYYGYNDLGEA